MNTNDDKRSDAQTPFDGEDDVGLSLKEIADVMGVEFETAKSYLALARERLRAKLGEWNEN